MGQQEIQTAYDKQLVTLGRVLQTIREEEKVETLTEATLDYLKGEFNYRLIWLGLYDRVEHRLVGKGGITPTGDVKFLKQKFSLNPGDLLEQVVIQLRPLSIPDLRTEGRAGEWGRAATEFGIQGTLVFPLRYKDRCFGVVMLGSHLWGTTPRTSEKAQLSLLFGGLATKLYQMEVEWQYASIKRPDKSLFQMLEQLQSLPTLANRLDVLVNTTHEFVAPTRTNLYWYSPDKRYFWQKVGNRQTARKLKDPDSSSPGLNVQDVSEFYLALAAGQTVAIGSSKSPLNAEVTGTLLSRFRARSILTAPVLVKGELVGFLAVEDNEARIWEDSEAHYVRAAAQLIVLIAGKEDVEAILQETQKDTNLIGEVASSMAEYPEPEKGIRQAAELILNRFGVERFLVLQAIEVASTVEYAVVYQQQVPKRSPLNAPLAALTYDSWQLIHESSEVLAIEDWEKDQRLGEWRETLLKLGMRSLLVCRTGNIQNNSLLIVAHGTARTWNPTERRVVGIVAQQIGVLLKNLELQNIVDNLLIANKTLQEGLTALLSGSADPTSFERAWIKYLAKLMASPLVGILGWMPQKPNQSKQKSLVVQSAAINDPRFGFAANVAIPLSDPLIREAIATRSFLVRKFNELPAESSSWLKHNGTGQLLVIPLVSSSKIPTGILLLVDSTEHQWSPQLLQSLETLVRQFTWLRQYRRLSNTMSNEIKELEQLNWYKHRCLEMLHHAVASSVSQLLSEYSDQGQSNGDPTIKRMRATQILHNLESTLTPLSPLLNEEQWQTNPHISAVLLGGLFKRLLRRVEPLFNQRQLTVMVKNIGSTSISANQLKLECILFDILLTACYKAKSGNRIDIWCRPLDAEAWSREKPSRGLDFHSEVGEKQNLAVAGFIELLIADSQPNKTSSENLEFFPTKDTNAPSANITLIEQPPNRQLKICQMILRFWGGDAQFYQLENSHFLSRLIFKVER
ncbi:MAG TPA: GAF domain-containing protein [Oculatellaceae cyanobacterium]|jgi:GAF domain-containing protein